VEVVRKGYDISAIPYKLTKDQHILTLPVFLAWCERLNLNPNKSLDATECPVNCVLDLGCGCGDPIAPFLAKRFERTPTHYVGVDVCEKQIELGKQEFPHLKECFQVGEMLEFCKKQQCESFCGVLALFSVFHLPRVHHVQLFESLKKILKRGAPLLITVPEKADEGFNEHWLGARMFWSHFSVDWYEMTLQELGFRIVYKYQDLKEFLGEQEITWYLLCVIPYSLGL